jgi:hypothetical protein
MQNRVDRASLYKQVIEFSAIIHPLPSFTFSQSRVKSVYRHTECWVRSTPPTKCSSGGFHDQAEAEWLVIRGLLRGHNDTPFGRPTPGQPIGRPGVGRPLGVFCMFLLLLISNVIYYYGLPDHGTRL